MKIWGGGGWALLICYKRGRRSFFPIKKVGGLKKWGNPQKKKKKKKKDSMVQKKKQKKKLLKYGDKGGSTYF